MNPMLVQFMRQRRGLLARASFWLAFGIGVVPLHLLAGWLMNWWVADLGVGMTALAVRWA
ncbi:MAG: hypothetical protein JW900_15250 [Anaerolineae bacterium]|nr:hypothetical protein [Anaerolineae bacterium]